jgi:FtsZ-interacting cell division protein ZipA
MDGNSWLWLVLGIIVIALLVAAAFVGTRKQKSMRIKKADSIRNDAAADETLLAQRESKAAELDAHARAAQAEADAKAAEAERLAATAQRQQAEVADDRTDLDDRLRRADEVDPRVDHEPDAQPPKT